MASQSEIISSMKILIKNGYYNPNFLIKSAELGDTDVVQFLIKTIPHVSSKDKLTISKNAAKTENLKLLKFLKEKGILQTTSEVFNSGVMSCNLDVIKFLASSGCCSDNDTFQIACEYGNFKILKWIYEEGCEIFSGYSAYKGVNAFLGIGKEQERIAKTDSALRILNWLYNDVGLKKFCFNTNHLCHSNIKIWEWFIERNCEWGDEAYSVAILNDSIEHLEYLYNQGCPWKTQRFSILEVDEISPEVLTWLESKDFKI